MSIPESRVEAILSNILGEEYEVKLGKSRVEDLLIGLAGLVANCAQLDEDGLIPIENIPPEVIERMYPVQDDTARFALTTDEVQNGDVVFVNDTQIMYLVVDETKLDSEDGYQEFAAGIAGKAIADEDGNNIKQTYVKKADEYNAGKTVPKGTVVTIKGQSYTVGDNAEIFNKYSKNKAVGNYSHAEGDGTTASGANSHAEGGGTTASGANSHAEGGGTTASGMSSHAEGVGTKATSANSHAEGSGTTASGDDSHAEGGGTTASGMSSHAEGGGTTASGANSHAEGGGTAASGTGSHAEGGGTKATSVNSHAEGSGTTASGDDSHAEGNGTTASGICSHAEGKNTVASKEYSHAEGGATCANGIGSHAEGCVTIASSNYQHVEGKYNVEDANDKFAHIIGNGTSKNARSNAYAVDWDGKIYTHNSATGFDINSNYLEMQNGIRLYISATAPTGDIPDGSVGVGW